MPSFFTKARSPPRKLAERTLRALDTLAERLPYTNVVVARDADASTRQLKPERHLMASADQVPSPSPGALKPG